jgi:hypothetical protein
MVKLWAKIEKATITKAVGAKMRLIFGKENVFANRSTGG